MPDKLPSMPFFVSDYLSNTDVLLMSLAERGLYTHLLFRQWQDGRPVFDTRKLSILCACSEPEFIEQWEGIKHKFVTDSDGRIYNRRAEDVKSEYTRIRGMRSAAGSKGGSQTQAKPKQNDEQAVKQAVEQNTKQNAKQTSSKNQPPVQSYPVLSDPVQTRPIQNTGKPVPEHSTARLILDHWNTFDVLTSHRALTEKTATSISARLKAGYSAADLCKAVTRYAELCQQGSAPGYNRWSLSLLMGREEGGWIDKMLNPKYEGITHETANDRRRKRNAEVLGFDPAIPRLDAGDTP